MVITEEMVAKTEKFVQLFALLYRLNVPRGIARNLGLPWVKFRHDTYAVEPISGHSLCVGVLGYIFVFEYADELQLSTDEAGCVALEVLRTGNFHDIAEALTGDITPADGITKANKQLFEMAAFTELLGSFKCFPLLKAQREAYESRQTYAAKIAKLMDVIQYILYCYLCLANGVGMIRAGDDGQPEYYLSFDGKILPLYPAFIPEIRSYFDQTTRQPIGRPDRDDGAWAFVHRMYDAHSAYIKDQFGECEPQLVELFELICRVAKDFQFQLYNPENLPFISEQFRPPIR